MLKPTAEVLFSSAVMQGYTHSKNDVVVLTKTFVA